MDEISLTQAVARRDRAYLCPLCVLPRRLQGNRFAGSLSGDELAKWDGVLCWTSLRLPSLILTLDFRIS